MNLLLICEIACGLPTPEFGAALAAHIDEKKHPDVRAASLTVWNLLACGMKQLGFVRLPEVVFEAGGKPRFTNADLCFSLSHSGNLAAALLFNLFDFMKQTALRAFGLVLVMTVLCGFLYTVVCTGINQTLFPIRQMAASLRSTARLTAPNCWPSSSRNPSICGAAP